MELGRERKRNVKVENTSFGTERNKQIIKAEFVWNIFLAENIFKGVWLLCS